MIFSHRDGASATGNLKPEAQSKSDTRRLAAGGAPATGTARRGPGLGPSATVPGGRACKKWPAARGFTFLTEFEAALTATDSEAAQ